MVETTNKQTKEDIIKQKVTEVEYIEEFIQSEYYNNFYKKFLVDLIDEYTNSILNDESPESFTPQYGMKEINLKVRKILIGLYREPEKKLKELTLNIKQRYQNT
jgi:chromosome condensin MukBEF MukE localization factor